VVYLPNGGETSLDLSGAKGDYSVHWFSPRIGGKLQLSSVKSVTAGQTVQLGDPPADAKEDWLVLVRNAKSAIA
jgi:hypothetical protein